MRSIAIINQKGGVGKTTTAVNLSAALARGGRRVVLVDLDPQAHSTLHLGVELQPSQPSLYDVLTGDASILEIVRNASHGLTIIPSHVDLVAAERVLTDRPGREQLLRTALASLSEHYDDLIIDCAPSLGILTINALAAVQEIVIPLQPHFLALQGLGQLLQTVAAVRAELNPALRVAGVTLCMYEKGTRLAAEVVQDVNRFLAAASPDDPWFGARVFDACIRRNIKLAECPSFGQTIFDYAPGSHGAEDYAALARELLTLTPPHSVAHTAGARAVAVDASTAVEALSAPGERPPDVGAPLHATGPSPLSVDTTRVVAATPARRTRSP
jgi:chromosome partitioning protein